MTSLKKKKKKILSKISSLAPKLAANPPNTLFASNIYRKATCSHLALITKHYQRSLVLSLLINYFPNSSPSPTISLYKTEIVHLPHDAKAI